MAIRISKKRLIFFLTIIVLWQLVLLGKIFYLKAFRSKEYELKARIQRERIIKTNGVRGKILDAHLIPLATSVSFNSVFVTPQNIINKKQTATILAQNLNLDPKDVYLKLSSKRHFKYIKRFIPSSEAIALKKLKLPGVGLLKENKRVYPSGKYGSVFVGIASLRNDKEIGLEGLEKEYESSLQGKPGKSFLEVDGRQNILKISPIEPAREGNTLILNIDSRIQYIVQRELEKAIRENHAVNGTVLVMDPYSGKILAMAVWPTFDPNNLKSTSPINLRNIAIEHYFEPGSTFKIVTLSGALDQHVVSPQDIINCGNGYITLSGHIIRDHRPFQNLNPTEILQYSSDVGAIKLGLRLGERNLYYYAKCFGFGEKTGIDLPAESRGSLKTTKKWSSISIGSISMGQEIGATAIQVLRAMAVIANGGYLVRPIIGDRIIDPQGNLVRKIKRAKIRVISPYTAKIVRDALVKTVDEGTGKLAKIPGFKVAGKTGTAQKFDPRLGRYSPINYVSSFVGFSPANTPAFVMAVIFDSPHPYYHGGEVSAPVFARIAKEILLLKKIKPSESVTPYQYSPHKIEKARKNRHSSELVQKRHFEKYPQDSLLDNENQFEQRVIRVVPENSFAMPNFIGKSVRQVMRKCSELGLIFHPSGSGIAKVQIPPAGARIVPNTNCTVWFTHDPREIVKLCLFDPLVSINNELTKNVRH